MPKPLGVAEGRRHRTLHVTRPLGPMSEGQNPVREIIRTVRSRLFLDKENAKGWGLLPSSLFFLSQKVPVAVKRPAGHFSERKKREEGRISRFRHRTLHVPRPLGPMSEGQNQAREKIRTVRSRLFLDRGNAKGWGLLPSSLFFLSPKCPWP